MAYQNDLEQHLLVNLHELLIPLLDVGGLLAGVGVIIVASKRIVSVMLAPLDNLLQDLLVDLCSMLVTRSRSEGEKMMSLHWE